MKALLKNNLYVFWIFLLAVFVSLSIVFNKNILHLPELALFCLLISMLLYKHKNFVLLLTFLIPLSVPMSVPGGSVLSVPSEVMMILLAFFTVVYFVFIAPVRKKILAHPVSILLLLLLLWDIVCSFLSVAPEVSFKRTLVSGSYVLIYYFLMAHLFSEPRMIFKIYTCYLAGLIIPVVYTLYLHAQANFTVGASPLICRPFYNDHTIYGAVLAFLIPFLIFVSVKGEKKYRGFYWLLTGLISTALFFSYSRAAWLSLLLAGVCFLFMQVRKKLFGFLVLTIVFSFTVFLWGDFLNETFLQSKAVSNKEDLSQHVQSVTNIESDVSNAERINRWKSALRMAEDRPWTGFGPGTYQFYYGAYQQRGDMTRISTYEGTRGHAHSEYLNRLSETGWPGFLLFVITALMVFYTGWNAEENTPHQLWHSILRMNVLALVTFYIHGFFNGFIETDKVAILVYAAMAAVVAIDVNGRK